MAVSYTHLDVYKRQALERLEAAIKLEPENKNTICLLATAYKNAGNEAKANEYQNKCVN